MIPFGFGILKHSCFPATNFAVQMHCFHNNIFWYFSVATIPRNVRHRVLICAGSHMAVAAAVDAAVVVVVVAPSFAAAFLSFLLLLPLV